MLSPTLILILLMLGESNASVSSRRFRKSKQISVDAINEGSPRTSTAHSFVDCITKNNLASVICFNKPECVATDVAPYTVTGTPDTDWACLVDEEASCSDPAGELMLNGDSFPDEFCSPDIKYACNEGKLVTMITPKSKCDPPFYETSIGCVFAPPDTMNWCDARRFCINNGADLIYPESLAEVEMIPSVIAEQRGRKTSICKITGPLLTTMVRATHTDNSTTSASPQNSSCVADVLIKHVYLEDRTCRTSKLSGAYSDVDAQCDPTGDGPCCSAYGYCGPTDEHCQCASCIDFRTSDITVKPPAWFGAHRVDETWRWSGNLESTSGWTRWAIGSPSHEPTKNCAYLTQPQYRMLNDDCNALKHPVCRAIIA